MDPPPSPHTSSATSFPILIISVLGILTTAILLLSYYIFVIKCCLNWRGPSLIFRTLSTATARRRPHGTIHSSPAELHGLDPSSIRAIPIIRFSPTAARKSSSYECAVCLNEFHEEESLRLLPACSHAFHIDCIDVWLQSNANCPICRSEITATFSFPFPLDQEQNTEGAANSHVVVEVRDDVAGDGARPSPSPRKAESSSKKKKKMHHVSSMGDECIDGRVKDERFLVQPMRRSFSMDSCNDRQLYVAMQEILRQNPEMLRGVDDGGGGGAGGRVRRSFFSFGHGRSWRKAVLPVQAEL